MKWYKTADPVCKKCAGRGHTMKECEEKQEQCVHCKEAHMAGRRECERQKEDEMLISIQDREKVSLMSARQILEGKTSERDFPHITTLRLLKPINVNLHFGY